MQQSHSAPESTPAERLVSLERALGATSAFEGPGDRILVLTHKSPDPDALGACVGLRLLLQKHFGRDASVSTTGRIFRAENLAMVRELELKFEDLLTLDTSAYSAATLVDSQPSFGHTVVPDDPPLAAVFDHHVPPREEVEREGLHWDVRLGVGSTSSLIFEYLETAGVELDELSATALFCGVRYDTADLSQDYCELDERAYFECLRRADRAVLARIHRPRLPPVYYSELSRCLKLVRRHGPSVVALLGHVPNPESVAEMADFFLRMEGCSWSFVGGAYENEYYLSLRTQYGFQDAHRLLEAILKDEGSFGGHGRVSGGRVHIDQEDPRFVRALERRLRKNVLEIVDPDGSLGDDVRLGTKIT